MSKVIDTKILYGPTGYFTPQKLIAHCIKHGIIRATVIGGRGTGKSIGTLQYLVQSGIPFVYSRRYATQTNLFKSYNLSPLAAVRRNTGLDYHGYRELDDVIGIYPTAYKEDGRRAAKPTGDMVGIAVPLSTGGGLKGFDGLDFNVLISDEIVPDATERVLANEGEAYRSLYETVNRNRDIDMGLPPLVHLAYGNSNRVANPFVVEYGYIPHLLSMKENKETCRCINGRELLIILDDSPISAKKAGQAHYQDGSKYARMAIDNDFTDDHFSTIRRIPHKEVIPRYKYGDLYISVIKSGGWYVSLQHPGGKPKEFKGDKIGTMQLKHQAREFVMAYWLEQVCFSEEMAESLLQQYLSIN